MSKQIMMINTAEVQTETLHSVWLISRRDGFGETVYLEEEDVARYKADPDLFAAQHYGFATVDEYREWVAADNAALCSERTKSGKLCGKSIGKCHGLDEWRSRHRSAPCSVHAKQGHGA